MTTIIFDFGNVLAFFNHAHAVEKLVRHTDMSAAELFQTLYGSPIEDQYERGQLSTAEYVRLGKQYGRLTCSDAEFLAAFVDIFQKNDETHALIPRLKPRYRLALASNTNAAHFGQFTQQFAVVLDTFDVLCPSHRCGYRKPEAEYFASVQQHVQADPDECLFIDDLASNVEAARRHGWRAICYDRPGTLAADLTAAGVLLD
ncbi:MAG: HAD family phosphatase [Bacteroidales bacterium]|nr:HAD family phosphatase [Bacteroidales bacterium]